ncbi:JmjC-domain-containing protein [Colletotrichum somersetense]|nr:JmjC-domain-containing protein [Colletotrichum somersetense]
MNGISRASQTDEKKPGHQQPWSPVPSSCGGSNHRNMLLSNPRNQSFECTVHDLGDNASKTLRSICEQSDVIAKGFAKVAVTDYEPHIGQKIKFLSSGGVQSESQINEYAMKKSTLQKDDGNFVIQYEAIDVVEGEMTVHLSAETSVMAGSDIFSSVSRAVEGSLGPSHLVHYYVGVWLCTESSHGPVLTCGPELEKAFGGNPKPGITTSYLYYAKDALTCSGMHLEDLFVPSVNLVCWGAPKAWLVLDPKPTNIKRFEKRVKECMEQRVNSPEAQPLRRETTARCSQFVRHQNTLFTTETLEDWNVHFNVVFCKPGELIVTMPGAYHQVINMGPNLAEAINVAWQGVEIPPPKYVYCHSKRCGHSSGISKADLAVV